MRLRVIARLLLSVSLLLAALSSNPCFAQTGTTSLRGTVTDKSGGVIAGAKITISNAALAVTRETQSSETGAYAFLALPPGTYKLTVQTPNFRTYERTNLELLVDVPNSLDVALEVGSTTETVEVNTQYETVNTTDATLGNAFDSRQILALPFEGRDAAAVLSLQPGAVYIGRPEDVQRDTNVDSRSGALNGGRSDQANITLDGVDNNTQLTGDAYTGAVRSTLDSIEEFRVTTAGANADQGRSSGGQIALVTKSGTNNFHGSAYIQDRSALGEANDWFNKHAELNNGLPNKPSPLTRNVFGASLGGPILKDRLFFFGTYEGLRQNQSAQVNRNVPSVNFRNGIVSYPDANGGVTTLTRAQIAGMDPNCSALGSCPQGPGPDPAALAVFNMYPMPNSSICSNNDGFNISCFTFAAPVPIHQNTSIAKLDYNLNRSGTQRLFIRGNYQSDSTASAPQFPGDKPNSLTRDNSRALGVGYTGVFSSNLINSFRYGFTRQGQQVAGLQTLPLVSFRFIDDLVPATSTRSFHVPVNNFVDDLSWTKGKHTLQFGTNIRRIDNDRTSNATSFSDALINPEFLVTGPANSGGSLDPGLFGYPEPNSQNLSVYNDAIIDLVGIVSQVTADYNRDKTGKTFASGEPVPRQFRSWEYEWYFQDVWHATSNLTVTAGLRYVILEPPYEVNGNQAAPDISLHDYTLTRARMAEQGLAYSPTFGFNLSGQANGKQPYWNYDYKDLGPRLAFAYSPNASKGLLHSLFGDHGKSSIRAGYGIVYDHFGEGIVNSFDQNGTFGLSSSIINGAGIQTVDRGARFTGLHDIPVQSLDGPLLAPPPAGGFPAVPPISTSANYAEQISFGLDDKLKTPYSQLVDLSFTRELSGGFTFEAAYVGRFARRLIEQRDLTQPINLKDPKSGMDYFTAASAFSKLFYATGGNANATIAPIPFWEDLFPMAAGTCGAGTTATQCMYEFYAQGNIGPAGFGETNALNILDAVCSPSCLQLPGQPAGGLPFQFYSPQFSALYAFSNVGTSSYNAGEFTLRSKPRHGVQFDFNYVFSKSLDIGSDAERQPIYGGLSAVINTWAPYQLRGPSDFDTRHAINTNFVVDLPFGRGKWIGHNWNRAMDTALGGWQVTGLGRWTSGFPFSVGPGGTYPTDYQLSGNAFTINAPPTGLSFITDPANNLHGDPFAFKGGPAADTNPLNLGPGGQYNFRYAYPGESGQRNNFRGQGFFGIDMGVNKNFKIYEGVELRLNANAYNVTNSVRFDPVSISASLSNSTSFGQYSNVFLPSRRFEFGARVSF